MRILHVSYIFSPFQENPDGVTSVLRDLAFEGARQGQEVGVCASNLMDLSTKKCYESGHFRIRRVYVQYCKAFLRFKTFVVTPSMIPWVIRNIDRFDIVHIHDCRSFQGIVVYLFARIRNVKYVVQPHGAVLTPLPDSYVSKIARTMLDNLITLRILRNASAVIALTKEEARGYHEFGIPSSRLHVIPNGIEVSKYSSTTERGSFRKKYQLDETERVLLYLGRIHRSKGLGLLARAFAVVSGALPNVRLLVVGPDDGYKNELAGLLRSLEIEERVIFTGFVSRDDKLRALVDSEVLVTPHYYGFPITFLEACACGCPIVTATRDLDWIDGNVGFVADCSPDGLAKALLLLLTDDLLRRKMQLNCTRMARGFEISGVASKLEVVYKSCIDRPY